MSDEFKDRSGCTWDSRKEYFWCEILGFCGCYSESLYALTFSILAKLYAAKCAGTSYYYIEKPEVEFVRGVAIPRVPTDTDLRELVLHVFDGKKLAEHGTAVRGCWLTDRGLQVCEFVFNNGEEP